MLQKSSADETVFSKAIQAFMWTAPTILSLVLLFCILSLGSEFRQMQQSLDTCSTMLGSGWETDAIPETTTITSTILTAGHAKWWFGDATTTYAPPFATEGSSPVPTEDELPHNALPTSTDYASDPQVQSLLPVNTMPFTWPIKLDIVVDAKASLQAVIRGLGTLWRVCRKIYHYPLDPS